MTRRFVSHDPLTGVTTWFEGDGAGGFRLHYEADVEDVLEANKAAYVDGTNGYTATREFKHVAEIPMSLILKWKVEEGIDVFDKNDWSKVKQRLNSNEWLYLRAAPGRI